MTLYAQAEFPLGGYPHFRQSFVGNDGGAGACESARVFSPRPDDVADAASDPDEQVTVLMSWPDRDTFARFRAEMERDMAAGGDMAPGVVSELDGAPAQPVGSVETEDLVAVRAAARTGG